MEMRPKIAEGLPDIILPGLIAMSGLAGTGKNIPAAGPRKSRRQRLRQGQMPGLRNRQNFFNNFHSCFYVFAVV